MSLYKRNGDYYIDIRTPGGERIRCSTKTREKKAAQEYHDKLKRESWEREKLDKKPEKIFDEALLLLLKSSEGQKDYDTKIRHSLYWRNVFGGMKLSSITGEMINNNLPAKNARTNENLSPATINKYRKTILRVFSLAHKAGWITTIPFVTKLKEPKIRN